MSTNFISSRQNPRVKNACALRNRSQREKLQQTLVYGVRESQRALHAGASVSQVYFCSEYFRSSGTEGVVEQLAAAGADVFELRADVFDKLAYGDRLDGVVSVFNTRIRGLNELQLPDRPLIAVLDGAEKPGNLGAICRSADGAGVDAVIVVNPVIDIFNPNAIRASVGTVFRENVVVTQREEAISWLRERKLAVWTTRPDAETWYYDAEFTLGGAIAFGSEARGLTDLWNAEGITPVALPMFGIADSLNVSATAAVLFYEARRQRNCTS